MSDYRRQSSTSGNGRPNSRGKGNRRNVTDLGEVGRLFDKLPPHSLENEMCLIGSLILAGTENIDLVGEVMQVVRKGDEFYLPKHGAIYDILIEQYDKHQSLDLVQLGQSLKDRQLYESVGGVDYLIELAESVPTAVNAPHYARIVHDKAWERKIINALGVGLKDIYESSDPVSTKKDRIERLVFEATQDTTAAGEAVTMAVLVQETFQEMQLRHESGRMLTGIPTNFPILDDMLGGLQPCQMIVIGARPSMGKTALATSIMEHVAVVERHAVAMFSLEMSKGEVTQRMLCGHARVDGQRVRRNCLSGDELVQINESAQVLSEAPILIDDSGSLSLMELRARARRLVQQHDVRVIFIDYLQLMTHPDSENRQNEIAAISRGLKSLGKDLNITIVAMAQLNRNVEGRGDRRPTLSDLRESGQLEQDADIVLLLHREEYYQDEQWKAANPDKCGIAQVIVAKQRNGPTGTVDLHFNKECAAFRNLAPRHLYRA